MKWFTAFWLSLLTVSVSAETTDIYQPDSLVAGVTEQQDISRRLGSWGVGVGQVARERLPAMNQFNVSGRYFAGERWYVLAGLQLSEFSDELITADNGEVLVKKDVTAVTATTGLGYQLMQGSASFSGNSTYPWQLGTEAYVGEQYTGDSSGRYLGIGISWQLLVDDYWLALEWKSFQVDDKALQQADIDKGMQWGISFGSFY